jgi:hypothetical protein
VVGRARLLSRSITKHSISLVSVIVLVEPQSAVGTSASMLPTNWIVEELGPLIRALPGNHVAARLHQAKS